MILRIGLANGDYYYVHNRDFSDVLEFLKSVNGHEYYSIGKSHFINKGPYEIVSAAYHSDSISGEPELIINM